MLLELVVATTRRWGPHPRRIGGLAPWVFAPGCRARFLGPLL